MEQIVAPLIQIRLIWATHHCWKPRQTLQFAAPDTALWLVTDGAVEVSDGKKSWQLKTGEAFFGSTAPFRRIMTQSGAKWLSMGMHVNFFDNLDLGHALALPVKWRPESQEWEALTRCTRELIRQWHDGEEVEVDTSNIAEYTQTMDDRRSQRPPIDTMIAESLGRAIFGMCWKRLASVESSGVLGKRMPHWLAETLRRVQDDPLVSVNELAQMSGFSPAQFRRSFGEHVGVSPRSYLINHRLEMARRLLQEDELPISAIASRCGFSSLSHFIHMFKQSGGLAPSQYRQATRSTPV